MSYLFTALKLRRAHFHLSTGGLRTRLGKTSFSCSVEFCVIAASVFFTLFTNQRFWSAWASSHDWSLPQSWLLAALTAVLLISVHCLILGSVLGRRTAKPVLAALFVITALQCTT